MPHFSSKIPGFVLYVILDDRQEQHARHFSKTLNFACAERTQN